MQNWIHVREQSEKRYDAKTGKELAPTFTSWIKTEGGDIVGHAADTYAYNHETGIFSVAGSVERGNLMAAAPEAIAFAKRMAEYFAQNPNGYDDLREMCQAVLQKAYPVLEVANAS